MDESSAKDYAIQFIKERRDHSCIRDWLDSGKGSEAQAEFEEIYQSDTPTWVLNRLNPLVDPAFGPPVAVSWGEQGKAIVACALTAAHESTILENSEEELAHFDGLERSVFWTDLVFENRKNESQVTLLTAAHMSHHTLARMLERELVSPNQILNDTREILMIARSIRQFFEITSLDQNKTWDLLIPFADGAFAARTLRANAGLRDYYQGNHRILSLRTFLDGNKLKRGDRERMAGFKLFKDAYLSPEDGAHMKAWIRGNARVHVARA